MILKQVSVKQKKRPIGLFFLSNLKFNYQITYSQNYKPQ